MRNWATNVSMIFAALIASLLTEFCFAAPLPGHGSVVVSVSPAAVTLNAGQSQQMTATVSGLSDQSITWSVNPSVGSISSSGLYTAPLTVPSSLVVTVRATSNADPAQTASSSVLLNPAAPAATSPSVAITLNPPTQILTAGQVQQFVPNITGTSNRAVYWTLNPPSGTITTGGIYTAPSTIDFAQTVTLTATSVADPSKSATASIQLQPVLSIVFTEACVPLGPSQSHQFKVLVSGTFNTAVTWSLNPLLGTISSTGLYTAPSIVTVTQPVHVIATSASDSSRTGQATVMLESANGSSCHFVDLTWGPSLTSGVTGYNLYRGTQHGGPYQKVNLSPIAGTAYTDGAVAANGRYYYTATAVDAYGNESVYSNEAGPVIVPLP